MSVPRRHNQTHAPQQTALAFDHLVRGGASDIRRTGVTEYLAPSAVQSALMPANLITFAHFSVSSAISFPKSAGEPDNAEPPTSARRAFILGSARAALTSLLSLSMISVGVLLGAPTPNHPLAS